MPITRYDRSPLEQAVLERDRFQDEVGRLKKELVDALDYRAGEFARYWEALEKARVALQWLQDEVDYNCWSKENRAKQVINKALSTIKDLLENKGGKWTDTKKG